MKVALNARTLATGQIRGWSRYTSNLVRELSHLGVDIYLFSDRELNLDLLKGAHEKNIHSQIQKGKNYLHWEQFILPRLCSQNQVDLLHCPINYGLPLKNYCPQILTIHDTIEKSFYKNKLSWRQNLSWKNSYTRLLYKFSQYASDAIITVSEHAKNDIVQNYNISKNKVYVIYEAADPIFDSTLQMPTTIQGDYFFYVGGFEKRKNIDFLIQCFQQLNRANVQLVLAGNIKHSKWGNLPNVKFLGFVKDELLPSLYANAKCFIYPSLYEGFGLQVVEAMNMNCPVICSNVTSLPEILGNLSATFSPTNSQELTALMNKVLDDPRYYQELKQWSQKRKNDFTWKKTAEQTLSVYKSLLN